MCHASLSFAALRYSISLAVTISAGLFVTCIPMGQAITAKMLHAESEAAKVFVDWIRKLFVS